MKVFEEIRDRVFSHYLDFATNTYINSDNVVVTITCPRCGREIDIERPDDEPPTGKNKCESWCYMCAGRFEYYY
jgi:hypothetical protein